MAGGATKTNPPRTRKRVIVETASLKRARDGSAFTRCEECNKDVPVVLIDMHCCSLDSKIRMNLESTVVEKAAETKTTAKVGNAKVVKSASKAKNSRKSKDSNMPKRPQTAYFLFLDDFRKSFKEANPDKKGIVVVAKEAGEKWKSMSDEEKQPYLDRHKELKAEYEEIVAKFNDNDDDREVIDYENEQGGGDDKDEKVEE